MLKTMHVSSQALVAVRPVIIKSIWAGIRFGAPGKNCQGSGICEIFELTNDTSKKRCNCWQDGCIKARGEFRLEFRFLNREMAEITRRKYFQNNYFIIEEDLELPKFLRESLGLRLKTLSSGMYMLRYHQHYTSLIVKLKRN